MNHTFISLILKIKAPSSVTNFRPISLCNVVYKIISKTLAERMKSFLPISISESQAAFVPGRQILDNVDIAHEFMHHLNNCRKGNDGFLALKLDMSKAYDRVEWSFVEQMLKKMGFDPYFQRMDNELYKYCIIFFPNKWSSIWFHKT